MIARYARSCFGAAQGGKSQPSFRHGAEAGLGVPASFHAKLTGLFLAIGRVLMEILFDKTSSSKYAFKKIRFLHIFSERRSNTARNPELQIAERGALKREILEIKCSYLAGPA
jgi:hypothetical protein